MIITRLLLLAALSAAMSSAGIISYTATLNGPNENPPSGSPGTGSATVTFDTSANTMEVSVSFFGLAGTTLSARLQCCTAVPFAGNNGVATQLPTFTGFPTGVTSGSYDHTFDLTSDSTYNPPFEAANGATAALAESALLAGAAGGFEYLNITTSATAGGEIRGFLTPTTTPEPATWLLSLAGLGLVFCAKRGLLARLSQRR